MKIFLIFAALTTIQTVLTGCGKTPAVSPGEVQFESIDVKDHGLRTILDRGYYINIPNNYNANKPTPLIIVYHWWGQNQTYRLYDEITMKENVIVVYPVGTSDFQDGSDAYSTFNTGDSNNKLETCTKTTKPQCNWSCAYENLCSRCNLFTCVDDISFTKRIIQKMKKTYCINSERIYSTGSSSGGMMTINLMREIPDIIQGFGIIEAGPFLGQLNFPQKQLQDRYIISLRGRFDQEIPIIGGIDYKNQWIYESQNNTFHLLGLIQGCDMMSWEKVQTPYDHVENNWNLGCSEYTRGCSGRLMACEYNGQHNFIPPYWAELSWWFWDSKYSKDQKPKYFQEFVSPSRNPPKSFKNPRYKLPDKVLQEKYNPVTKLQSSPIPSWPIHLCTVEECLDDYHENPMHQHQLEKVEQVQVRPKKQRL